jgi:hypothetical protein
MKIGYFDESGTGSEPYAVMAGIIVDSQRMHKTKDDWNSLLESLSRVIEKRVDELHTRDFYPGNGIWRGMSGQQRADVISEILKWLAERKHELVFSVIDKELYNAEKNIGKIHSEIDTIWKTLGFHIILGIQKRFQSFEKNKGNTILIFDNEETERAQFNEIINNPPAWSDSYYSKDKKKKRLDQIVDVPYWGDSTQIGLLQLADFISYFVRRYVEIKEEKIPPKYDGEALKLDDWYTLIKKSCVSNSIMYPSRGRCETAELFYKIAPPCIK